VLVLAALAASLRLLAQKLAHSGHSGLDVGGVLPAVEGTLALVAADSPADPLVAAEGDGVRAPEELKQTVAEFQNQHVPAFHEFAHYYLRLETYQNILLTVLFEFLLAESYDGEFLFDSGTL
jgi:hypothetical protein